MSPNKNSDMLAIKQLNKKNDKTVQIIDFIKTKRIQSASGEVSLTILLSNTFRKCSRVFFNNPSPNEQFHTRIFLAWLNKATLKIVIIDASSRILILKEQIWFTHRVDWKDNLKIKMISKLKTT